MKQSLRKLIEGNDLAIVLKIAGWTSEGLRCPDHTIDLSNAKGDIHKITFLQMPNGTGKTTTLELLRAALSGSASINVWSDSRILSFKKRDHDSDRGEFKLRLLENDKRITIRMVFDFNAPSIKYFTTIPSVGKKRGYHPPRTLARFLEPDFVNLFIFDGELAERLLNKNYTNAQDAIEELFQLKIFSQMDKRVQEYWDSAVKYRTAKTTKGYNKYEKRILYLRERIEFLQKNKLIFTKEKDQLSEDIEKKSKQFADAIAKKNEYKSELMKVVGALSQNEHDVENISRDILHLIKSPIYIDESIANKILDLKNSLDKVKLPESAAKEFFYELAEETECVCGRLLDEKTRAVIKEKAASYLGSEDVAFLNSM